MKKKIIGAAVIVLLAGLVFIGFYKLINKESGGAEENKNLTEIQTLINTDYEKNYPATPRAVVNLYSRMLACMYNEEYTEEELDGLLKQMYLLLDDELQGVNPFDNFKLAMQADLTSHGAEGWTITNYTLPDTDEVTYEKIGSKDMALLTVSYFIKDETGYIKSYQDFVLCQDGDSNWKIYGYSLHN